MAQKLFTLAAITISTAGTRQAISSTAVPVASYLIEADASNTGKVYVGDSTVASTNGVALSAGESLSAESHEDDELDLSDVYVDTATNGNKVRVQYIKRR